MRSPSMSTSESKPALTTQTYYIYTLDEMISDIKSKRFMYIPTIKRIPVII